MSSRKITKKQEYLINIIVEQLGLIIDGEINTKTAYDFINENIKSVDINRGLNKKGYYNFPTIKQWNAIECIEKRTGTTFNGNSFEDACDFINDNQKPIKRVYQNSGNYHKSSKISGGCYVGYDAHSIEKMLDTAIFYSGGVGIYSDDRSFW